MFEIRNKSQYNVKTEIKRKLVKLKRITFKYVTIKLSPIIKIKFRRQKKLYIKFVVFSTHSILKYICFGGKPSITIEFIRLYKIKI